MVALGIRGTVIHQALVKTHGYACVRPSDRQAEGYGFSICLIMDY